MQKGRISIRYKILFLLSSLPLVALGAYLVLALNIFKQDKLAYVFDSSRTISESMAAQVRTELASAVGRIQGMTQGFNYLTGSLNSFSKGVFESDASLESVAFLLPSKSNSATYYVADQLSKYKEQQLLDVLGKGSQEYETMLQEIRSQGFSIYSPYGDDRVILGALYGRSVEKAHYIVLTFIRAEELAKAFSNEDVYSVYLIRDTGEVIFGPLTESHRNLGEKLSLSFLPSNQGARQPSGVRETNDHQGKEYLASYAKVGFAGLSVVSLVQKANALQAVDLLVRKSLLFFIALISSTGIVSVFASRSLTSSLLKLSAATTRIAKGHFDERVQIQSRDEVGDLANGFNFMAGEVERLLTVTAEKARMEAELQTAHMVQDTLFPAPIALVGDLDIAGHYQPATECGGDWFHYCEVDGKLLLWIGDATGHGAPAALLTSAAKSAASIIEKMKTSPAEAMALLNHSIYSVANGKLMMTFFLGSYDPKTGVLTYANASHEPPYLLKYKEETYKKKDLFPLVDVNGPRLGHDPNSTYEQGTIEFHQGDRLILFTDGIADVQNEQGEMWGERNFLRTLLQIANGSTSAASAMGQLVNEFSTYQGSAHLLDDVTFLICQNLGGSSAKQRI